MLKIRALNRDSLSDEDAPVLRKELQEEIALEMYNNALRLEGLKEFEKSKELLLKLLNENIPQLENQGGLPKSMTTLKFACYLNLGHIFHEVKNNDKALEYYLIASELDQSDITLWYKIGKLSLEEHRFKQSIYAFSKGLDCYDSHWPCLEEIIPLLFAVKDTVNCLLYIGKTLELNPNYTKGLVLRKKIYQDNPATREYYQTLNPDHKWEPPIDVKINHNLEEKYLNEVQAIIDTIREEEKALESESLKTIPLPKALENNSWVSLSKCILNIYEYLQSNEMSLLTFVNLDKCMSVDGEHDIHLKNTEKDEMDTREHISISIEENNLEDKADVGVEMRRRPSQNSEGNGTPVQTDVDDEQQTEQDTEEQDEKNDKLKCKNLKRKRDLLSDLRVWGWHSKRKNVRKTRPDKFYTVEDCLNQILPSNLLRNKIVDAYIQDESMNDVDEKQLLFGNNHMEAFSQSNSPPTSGIYFGSLKEKDDIMKLWNDVKEDCDVTILIREYIRRIAKLWNIKWPKELISHYIFIHERYSEFYHLPNIYDPENKFEDIRIETLSNLLYAELVLFSGLEYMEENNTCLNIGQVQFVESSVALWETNWKEEYISIFSRIIWLRAYIAREEKNYDTAVRYLELMKHRISEEEKNTGEKCLILLPNSYKFNNINLELVEKYFRHLHMIKSVSCLEELFDQNKYDLVSEIVVSTFESDSGYPTVGKIGRPTQLGMLLHSLWYTDFDKCFLWCEECLFESYPHYTKAGPNRPQWEGIVEKCLLMMHEIIKNKSRNVVDILSNEKKARLTETLARIICKQIYAENNARIPLNTVAPWLILHHLLAKNEENIEKDIEPNENEVPASLAILFSAHEFLGPKGWCLTGKGELLHYILDVLLDKEDAYKYEKLREKLDIQIEQALFCLYQHPSKKNKISRHLADHNVDPLPLTWEKSFQLYEFYAPEVLPEFNSFKNASITMDLEQLLLRITALVTPECNPSVSIPKIKEYLQGKTDIIPEPIEFPYRIQAIYYLLGDYYFKLKDFVRCVDFFLMDLAINPKRVDSWACLGLSYLNQLEIKLNFCKKMKNEEEFLDRAKYAQVSFTTALKLSPENITLWIEYASFEYMAHSFCSRYLGHESENMSMEKFTQLENKKNAFLESSRQSFEKAISLYDSEGSEPDERWLHYYILGKIAEKKQSEPKEYLGYYLTASQLLDENNATYPEKIAYNSPQHLSVEALELHYRMNASILKYLELHEGKQIDHSVGALFKKSLDALPINQKLVAIRAQKKLRKSTEIYEKSKMKNCEVMEEEKNTLKTIKEIESENIEEKEIEKSDGMMEISKSSANEKKTEKLEIKKIDEDKNGTIVEVPSNDETNIYESTVENNSKVEKDGEKKDEKEVRVVNEVILVDSEYDVILILSSDDEESNDSKGVEKDRESNKRKTEDNLDNQVLNKLESSEKVISRDENVTRDFNHSEETIVLNANEKISEQIASGVDVQLILDKMMQETMKTTGEHLMEIDSDTVTGMDRNVENIDTPRQCERTNKENKIDDKEKESDGDENKKSTGESTTSGSSSSSSDSSSSESESDDESTSDSSSSSSEDSATEYLSKNETIHLVERCIKGLELCIIRLPKNYKAVYRLVHLFFHYREKKDLNKCKQLLLGEYKCYENSSIMGLFSDRKNNNFFNGIWRIPSSEIDRPGSLSAHMIRCVTILLQILRITGDFKILLDMYFQLKKCPDPDKIYIKDTERIQFSDQAISLSIQILRENIHSVARDNNICIQKLLQDIYKVYLRIQKYAPEKENVFGSMLVDLYKLYIKDKIPDTVNTLELVIKFCQQMKLAEKQNLIASQNLTLQNPLAPMGPVLPSPATVNAGNSVIKRPSGMGRPRGRPPLPKIPGQVKSPRNRSWKKSSEPKTQDYLKHYKDELMKQYNQNLNFLQSAQFTQLYSNSLLSSYMQAQQSSILGGNFLQQLSALGMAQGTSVDPLRMNFSMKQYEEMAEMMKKVAEMSKKETTTKKFKSSKDSPLSSTNKVDSPNSPSKKIEQSMKKHKISFDQTDVNLELPLKKQKIQTDLDKAVDSCQQKKFENTPSISILPVSKEKNQVESYMSGISIIPKGNDIKLKDDSEKVVETVGCKITKKIDNMCPSSSETLPKNTSLECAKPQFPLSVIMPPPTSSILPPSSSISNVNQSNIGTNRQSLIGSKTSEPKVKLMETTISRPPQIYSECKRKIGKDDLQSSINFAEEAGLLKFPPCLSMTPVSSTQKPASEFQQSISLLKTSSVSSKDSYVPKLPSSITLTPSVSKSNDFLGHTLTEATKDLKKPKGSSFNKNSLTSVNCNANKTTDCSKNKGSTQLKNVEQMAFPFNVDSMLQPSLKSKAASPHLSYNFVPPQAAHTSVITSTISSLNTKISSMFAQPNPVLTDKRCPPKTIHGFPTKSKVMARNILSSEFYKVDDQRHFDLQMYSSPKKDSISSKSPSGSTSVIMSINKPSTFISSQMSPVKTLQEKLADKKREQANKQLLEQMNLQKPLIQQSNVNSRNPHSVSKILSQSSIPEIPIPKVTTRNVQLSLPPQTPRRKSSSDESVIFLD